MSISGRRTNNINNAGWSDQSDADTQSDGESNAGSRQRTVDPTITESKELQRQSTGESNSGGKKQTSTATFTLKPLPVSLTYPQLNQTSATSSSATIGHGISPSPLYTAPATPTTPHHAHTHSLGSVTTGNVNVIRSKERPAAGVSTSMTAKAARESNLASSLTSYLQNQLSLLAKRGHAREVLKMLEMKEGLLLIEEETARDVKEETSLDGPTDMQISQSQTRRQSFSERHGPGMGGTTMVYAPLQIRRPGTHQDLSSSASQPNVYFPTGSSNPLLPPLPTVRLNLPSQLWTGVNQGHERKAPEDSLTRKAHESYERLAAQREWVRRREEKEEDWFRNINAPGPSTASPASWEAPYQSRGPEADGHDGFGRKMLKGLASDDEKRRRFDVLSKTRGDPVPNATALKSYTNIYAQHGARDVRPYVSGQVHTGADRNAVLDYTLLKRKHPRKWNAILSTAKEQLEGGTNTSSSYPSGSMSARTFSSSPSATPPTGQVYNPAILPRGFEQQPMSKITSINPPLPPRSLRRNMRALAYRMNMAADGGAGMENSIAIWNTGSISARSSPQQSPAQAALRKLGPSGVAHIARHMPSSPYSLPQQPVMSNIYSTAGFTPSDLGLQWNDPDDEEMNGPIGAYGSYSATGGFQKLRWNPNSAPGSAGYPPPGSSYGSRLGSPAATAGAGQSMVDMTPEQIRASMAAAELARWKSSLLEKEAPQAELPNTHASVFQEPDESEKNRDEQSLSALLDFSDRNGSTPLFHASWEGFTQIIALLCEYGADVNVRNVRRHTAMDMAVERSHMDVVKILLRFGSDATYTEAKAARLRCHARLGQTYANWLKRMRQGKFLPPATETDGGSNTADGVQINTANLPSDTETQYYLPLHVQLQQTDREILQHFQHTIFFPDSNTNESGGVGMEYDTSSDARQTPLRSLTREARQARKKKLATERAEVMKFRKKYLGGSAAGNKSGGLTKDSLKHHQHHHSSSSNSIPSLTTASTQQQEDDQEDAKAEEFDRTRSVISNFSTVRERTRGGKSAADTKQHPTGNNLPQTILDDDDLTAYESDLIHIKAEIARQRKFYQDQSALILRRRVERDASYSAFEAWVDCLDLSQAVMLGNLNEVERILIAHPEHSAWKTHGCTLLYHAAYHGYYSIARALLAASIEHRLDTGLEAAAARAVSFVVEGVVPEEFNHPNHPFYDPDLAPDGLTKKPQHEQFVNYYDTNTGGATEEPDDSGSNLSSSLPNPTLPGHLNNILDVNFLCVDLLKTKEEAVSDQQIKKQIELRSQHRLLRRILLEKKDQAKRLRELEKQKQRELGIDDSNSEDEDDDITDVAVSTTNGSSKFDLKPSPGSAAPPGPPLSKQAASRAALAAREKKQKELDELIDVPEGQPANPLQFQLWHEWFVKPRKWNRYVQQKLELRKSTGGTTSYPQNIYDSDPVQKALAGLLSESDPTEEPEPDVRYETAIYVAIRRKHYRLALLLHQFGAISPYKQSDLLLLCDIQLRARRLMHAIRAGNYNLIQSILNSAQGVSTGTGAGANKGILTQLLQYQDTNGSNPVLLSIQKNDLKILDMLKQATLGLGSKFMQGQTGGNKQGVLSSTGETLFGRLLSTIKDRLGYTALEKSILQAASSSGGSGQATGSLSGISSPGGTNTASQDITSYLLTQGGLVLKTENVLDLILHRQGEDSSSSSTMSQGQARWEVNKEGVEKLRHILMSSLPTTVKVNSGGSTPQKDATASPGGGALSTPMDVVNFTELHASLNANAFHLKSEEMAELREQVQDIEEKYKAMKIARPKKTPGGDPLSPGAAKRALSSAKMSDQHINDHELQPWNAEMHVVHEGLEPSESTATLPGLAMRSSSAISMMDDEGGALDLLDSTAGVDTEEHLAARTLALQKQIAQVDADEQAKVEAKEEQRNQLEQLKADILAGGTSDDSDGEGETATDGNDTSRVDRSESPDAGDTNALDDLLGTRSDTAGGWDSSLQGGDGEDEERDMESAGEMLQEVPSPTRKTADDSDSDMDDLDETSLPPSRLDTASSSGRGRTSRKGSKVGFRGVATTSPKKRPPAVTFSVPASALGVSPPRRHVGGASPEKRGPVIEVTGPVASAAPPPPPVLPDLLTPEVKARLVWMLDEVAEVQDLLKEFLEIQHKVQATAQALQERSMRRVASLSKGKNGNGEGKHSRSNSTATLTSNTSATNIHTAYNPFAQAIANAQSVAVQQLDANTVRWNHMLKMNPFLYQLVGVDFPLDAPRVLTLEEIQQMSSSSRPAASSTAPSRRASLDATSGAAILRANSIPLSNPGATTTSAAPSKAYSRSHSRRGSIEGSYGESSLLVLPAALTPRGSKAVSRPGTSIGVHGAEVASAITSSDGTDSSNQPSEAPTPQKSPRTIKVGPGKRPLGAAQHQPAPPPRTRELLPHERIDPPERTITLASWIESFQRLARESSSGGMRVVTDVLDEFARVAKLMKSSIRRAREEANQKENEATGLQPIKPNSLVQHAMSMRSKESTTNPLFAGEVDLTDVDTRALGIMTDFSGEEPVVPQRSSLVGQMGHHDFPQQSASSIFTFVAHLDPREAPAETILSESAALTGLRALEEDGLMRPGHSKKKSVRWRGGREEDGEDEDNKATLREELKAQLLRTASEMAAEGRVTDVSF